MEAGTAVEWQAGSRQSPGEAPGGCMAFCARGAYGRGRGMEQGSVGHFRVPGAIHDLVLPQHSPLPVQSMPKVRDGAHGREGTLQPVRLWFMRAPSRPSRRFQSCLSVFPH